MNIFKKHSVLAIILIGSLSTSAQEVRIKAGLNFSTMVIKDNDMAASDDLKLKHGYLLGATVSFPFSEKFGLETGLLCNTKGYRTKISESIYGYDLKAKSRLELLYVDIPINLKYLFNAGKIKMYVTGGPYVGFGIFGKSTYESTYLGEKEKFSNDIKFGSNKTKDDLKIVDFGTAAGIGIDLKSWQIGLSYALGLANLAVDSGNGFTVKNRVIGIAAAYRLGKNNK